MVSEAIEPEDVAFKEATLMDVVERSVLSAENSATCPGVPVAFTIAPTPPTPVASLPSQRLAEPVIETQKSLHEVPVTPPKLRV
jgi:hypothetical protein